MLLDKYVLTKAFENLLSYHNPSSSNTPTAAPASFVKRVNNTMTRIDPLLKTLQVRPSPPEGLVQAYLIHIGDGSDTNFKKILELKGVRKTEQPHLVELFGIHRDAAPSSGGNKLVAHSPLLTPLLNTTGLGSSGIGGGHNQGGAAPTTRFDPTSLGEKLLSAARDSVERIGTPSQLAGAGGHIPGMVGTGGASAVLGSAGGQSSAIINENLKNFGKFFRRDIAISGLGARFGKRDVSGSGASGGE